MQASTMARDMNASSSQPLRILAVEDDPLIARFLIDALTGAGHDVRLATRGADALDAARAQAFDLLLVDLQLPDTDGAALLAGLRADRAAASRGTTAIAMSGELTRARRTELLALGFTEAWQKPVPLAALESLSAPGGTAAHVAALPDQQLSALVLDDTAALSRLGNEATMRALRGLLAAELPRQWRAVIEAVDAGDPSSALSVLHQARASCTLCGANAAAAALGALEESLRRGDNTTPVRAQADAVITRTLKQMSVDPALSAAAR
jgi:CheY-like chemotaxis protein